MNFRALLIAALVCAAVAPSFADSAEATEDTPEELRAFVAAFNLARPKDFDPLLVEDILCSREVRVETEAVADAFPHLSGIGHSKTDLMKVDKPLLRQFRVDLAKVVARRKAADVKAAAAQSTRFGPIYRELGKNLLTVIADIDAALKIDSPSDYFNAARLVREDGQSFAETFDHTSRAFYHLAYEYRTIDALRNGKPRPQWKEPEPNAPLPPSDSPLDLQVN